MSQTLHCCKQLRLLLTRDEYQRLSYSSCRRRTPRELLVRVAFTDARCHCRSCEFQQIVTAKAAKQNAVPLSRRSRWIPRVRQRILATGVFVAGLCEAGGSRWAGVTTRLTSDFDELSRVASSVEPSSSKSDPGYNFRERMPESVGAPGPAVSVAKDSACSGRAGLYPV
jgi:hypothetical protein